jgi:hypothetical protein
MKYSPFLFVGVMLFLSACSKYERVHRSIYDGASDARLQLLARQSVRIADTLGPTNALFYLVHQGFVFHESRLVLVIGLVCTLIWSVTVGFIVRRKAVA